MKRVYFCTLGCRVNQYESVSLCEMLIKRGYRPVKDINDADLIVVNTCAVTAESARKSAQAVRRGARLGVPVAVLGCASQLQPQTFYDIDGVIFVAGCGKKGSLIDFIDGITDKVSDVSNVPTDFEPLEIGSMTTELFSSCRAYVKIQDGCNCRCAYCTIPFARGRSRSREAWDIIDEVKRLAEHGYREVELTGIETGAYSLMPLGELIMRVGEVDGIERIRLGSLSPNCITPDFINAIKQTRQFMPHLHISAQSGSKNILRAMRRPYTAETLYNAFDTIESELPGFAVSVDLISGFPTETDEDFAATLEMVKKYRFLHVHGFPYSERAGTLAAEMPGRIPVGIRRKRNEMLLSVADEIYRDILSLKHGTNGEVLIERVGGICRGHTADYIECCFEGTYDVGDIVSVEILSDDGKMLKAAGKGKR